eukprot:102224_1
MWKKLVNNASRAISNIVNISSLAVNTLSSFVSKHPGVILCPLVPIQPVVSGQTHVPPSPYNTEHGLQRLRNSFGANTTAINFEFGDVHNALEDPRTKLSLRRIENKIEKCLKENKISKANRWKWYKDQFYNMALDGIVIIHQNYSSCFPDIKGVPCNGRMNYECATDILDCSNKQWRDIQKYEYLISNTAIQRMDADIETLNVYWGWWANKHKDRNYYFAYDANTYGIQTKKPQNKYVGKKRFGMNDDNDNSSNTNINTSSMIEPPFKRQRQSSNSLTAQITPNISPAPKMSYIPSFNPYTLNNFGQTMAPPKGKILNQRKKKKSTKTKAQKKDEMNIKTVNHLGNFESGLNTIINTNDKIG